GPAICQALASSAGDLPVITLDPGIEQKIAGSIQAADERARLLLEPKFAEMVIGRLAGQVEQMMKSNTAPVLLCAPELRRHLRSITERVLPHLAILSMSEVPATINLRSFGVVKA
ncbi:MAG: FHIPEP family type III secretion protein, partial [Betaproteobacteria bacterium]|nr:FHIPEP family type III secretion protein [Betaproteobacteria bacterium]